MSKANATSILLVDDHSVLRRGLKELLAEAFGPVEFGEAGDAADAIDLLHDRAWDLVLLDITLPGRSGFDVLREARRLRKGVPVLVLSMHPEDQYAVRALRAGAAGYLTKRAAPLELVQAAHTVLTGRRYITADLAQRMAAELSGGEGRAPHERLSDRELQVMRMIALGKSLKEIALELSLSPKTVTTYRTRILEKMGLKTNSQLTQYALGNGLVG